MSRLPAGQMAESIDAVLARLRWGEDSAETHLDLRPGVRVCLVLYFDEPDTTREQMLRLAESALESLDVWEAEYRRWTATELAGNNWSDPPLTADEIYQLMTVATLEVREDGQADIFWDDSDVLFWGNNVVTRLDAAGQCVETGMA